MIQVSGLDHIVLRTAKIEEMLEFYRDTLGCAVEKVQKKLNSLNLELVIA